MQHSGSDLVAPVGDMEQEFRMFAVQHMRHKSVMGHAFRSFLMLSVYTGGLPAGVALAATVTDEKQRRTPVVAHHAASTPQAHDHHAAPEVISVTRTRRPFSADQHRAGNTTNLTAEELVTHHVTTVEDIQNLVPNLTIQTEGGSNVPDYYLRGIGMQDYTQNNMSSVMTYFDGVPYTITAMSSGQMFDVASVGVDPGPVGFEHGIADTGGEVRITTNDPTKTLHYGVSEDIASYARSKTNFYVSGPITKRLQFRIAGQMLEGGAFRYNRVNGESLGRANEGALRAKLAWQPDDKTNIKLTGNWSQDSSEADAGFILGDNSNILPRDRDIYATGWSLNPQYAKILGISPNSKPSYNDMQWGINLDMERDLGWARLTTISSFQQQQRHEYIDRDAEAYRSGDSYLTGSTNVFSQEIRLSGRVLDDRLQWVTGMYYNRVRASGENWFDYTDRSGKYYFQNSAHVQPQQDFAQFVNLTYSLTHKLRLTFGLEHQTDDRQFLDDAVYRYNPVTLARTYSQVFGNHGTLTNQFSGKVGINYQVQPNVMLYADIRRGVKPGGFTANTTLTEQQAAGFKPEWLMAYEVGFKSEFFNHRLRINGAAFWDSYHDQQYFSYILVPNWGTVGSYVNVPRSHIFGTELSISAHPVRGLTLSQNVGYQRGTYDDFQVLNVQAVSAYYARTGTWKSFTDSYNGADMGIPKLTLNGTVSYETRPVFGKYTVTMEGDYSYRGAQDTVPRGTGAYLLPSYFLMNGSVTFKPVRGPWSVTAYATNILNRDYIVSRTLATTVNMGISGQPRFVGGRFAYNF